MGGSEGVGGEPDSSSGATLRGAAELAERLAQLGGVRVKSVRHRPIVVNGRCELTLFEAAEAGEGGVDDAPTSRAHPRLRARFAAVPDPTSPALDALLDEATPPGPPPTDGEAALEALGALWRARFPELRPTTTAGASSPAYVAHRQLVHRKDRFAAAAGRSLDAWVQAGRLSADAAALCLARLRDRLNFGLLDHAPGVEDDSGRVIFDDNDTGTYHSFEHDEPFVHVLERLEASLPTEGAPGWSALDDEPQRAVQRQRAQLRAHIDHLMRHKYAYAGVDEQDIERSVGGQLIDRDSREVVSERPESSGALAPEHERLHVAEGALSGRAVVRDGALLRLAETWAPLPPDTPLRRSPVAADRLTFRRAPGDPRLRAGLRFDWDGDGLASAGGVPWVSWAGHCDIKAVMEALGLDLWAPLGRGPTVEEHRVETGHRLVLDRKLLIELLAASLELGSAYRRLDTDAPLHRGERRFGGARNDARPDRLQLQGMRAGEGFRWPVDGRSDRMRVVSLRARGAPPLPLGRAFARRFAAFDPLRIEENPRFIKVVDGDCNLIDVRGHLLEIDVLDDTFDLQAGGLQRRARRLELPLWPASEDGAAGEPGAPLPTRLQLGALITEPQRRGLAEVWLNRVEWSIEIVRQVARPAPGGGYVMEADGATQRIPLLRDGELTLSRELRREDPSQFAALLDRALRGGENICADTDKGPEVWNGVVLRIEADQPQSSLVTRTERWRARVEARFGEGTLDWLLERGPDGRPLRWCAAVGDENAGGWPDFLWQDLPDVGSKGREAGAWIVNETMLRRGLVSVQPGATPADPPFVADDHIKHAYELLFCALGGYPYTLLVGNRRYGFREKAAWQRAVEQLSPAPALV